MGPIQKDYGNFEKNLADSLRPSNASQEFYLGVDHAKNRLGSIADIEEKLQAIDGETRMFLEKKVNSENDEGGALDPQTSMKLLERQKRKTSFLQKLKHRKLEE